jgi:hypothetical protein
MLGAEHEYPLEKLRGHHTMLQYHQACTNVTTLPDSESFFVDTNTTSRPNDDQRAISLPIKGKVNKSEKDRYELYPQNLHSWKSSHSPYRIVVRLVSILIEETINFLEFFDSSFISCSCIHIIITTHSEPFLTAPMNLSLGHRIRLFQK